MMISPIGSRHNLTISMLYRCRHPRGFTLLEIVLVLVFAGVLAGMTLPAFSGRYQAMVLRGKADDVAHVMRYAQSRAIADKKTYQVHIDLQQERVQLLDGDQQGSVFSGRWGRAIHIDPVQAHSDDDHVSFYPDGRIDPIDMEFSYRDKTILLTTKEQRGYVRVSDVY